MGTRADSCCSPIVINHCWTVGGIEVDVTTHTSCSEEILDNSALETVNRKFIEKWLTEQQICDFKLTINVNRFHVSILLEPNDDGYKYHLFISLDCTLRSIAVQTDEPCQSQAQKQKQFQKIDSSNSIIQTETDINQGSGSSHQMQQYQKSLLPSSKPSFSPIQDRTEVNQDSQYVPLTKTQHQKNVIKKSNSAIEAQTKSNQGFQFKTHFSHPPGFKIQSRKKFQSNNHTLSAVEQSNSTATQIHNESVVNKTTSTVVHTNTETQETEQTTPGIVRRPFSNTMFNPDVDVTIGKDPSEKAVIKSKTGKVSELLKRKAPSVKEDILLYHQSLPKRDSIKLYYDDSELHKLRFRPDHGKEIEKENEEENQVDNEVADPSLNNSIGQEKRRSCVVS